MNFNTFRMMIAVVTGTISMLYGAAADYTYCKKSGKLLVTCQTDKGHKYINLEIPIDRNVENDTIWIKYIKGSYNHLDTLWRSSSHKYPLIDNNDIFDGSIKNDSIVIKIIANGGVS